ncbi:hypothetical protein F7Q99_34880 [Streptomyces kaniharaensis]|uniref:Uncharacterized protein n=1 Tax=Streptomyces kaniharaensis TaxID=212423 RepID=A0A6N7L3T8_9ACTN|nr:hypothetical protein [Streptomyces kaniharaensis]MQS17228.1 hypothetical protein [Streptomyces kaniharaensis]
MTTNDVIDEIVSGVGNLPELAQQAQDWAMGNLWWVAACALLVAVAVSSVQRLMSRSTLSNRTAFEVLPTNGFDPALEDVLRFAKQIARAQRSTSRWALPARGTAMRVRLMSVGGPLTLRVEGPARATTVLRHQGYAQCELRAVTGRESKPERPKIRLGVHNDGTSASTAAA